MREPWNTATREAVKKSIFDYIVKWEGNKQNVGLYSAELC